MERKFFKRGLITSLLQVLLMVMFIPFLLGQNECPINQNLNSVLQDLVIKTFIPPLGQDYLYITRVSFIDVENKDLLGDTEESHLINKAVEDGIWRATKINPKLKYNERGHIIVDNELNHNKLTRIMFHSPTLTAPKKTGKIIHEMMGHVDALVSGYHWDKGEGFPTIKIMPLVIVKEDKRYSKKVLTLSKREYLCTDPADSSMKALCPGAHEKIAKAVKNLLEQL